MADYSELKRKAQEIRDEVKAGANTANRVGLALEDTVNALEAENQRAEQAEVSLGNAVQLLQDNTEDLPSIREKLENLVVNDLTTGGADKALSAEMGKVLGLSVEDLKERIYDLGDFGRSSQAEAEAGKADIAGNPGIVLIRYTVDNKNGIILQQVGETITTQILLWDSVLYQRHINFSGSDKTSVSSTSYWYKIGATHTSYDAETRRLHLQDMNYSNLNPSIDAVLPLASEAEAGLMSKEQVAKLRGAASNADLVKKQNKLKTYSETSDGKTVDVVSSSSVKMEAKPESNTTYARVLITANDYAVDYTAMVGRSGLGDPTSLSLGYNSIELRTGGNIEMKSAQGTVYDVVGAIVSRESDGVSLLENGNIKLTLRGTTKEFMPATPSGDPLHYVYEAAGAEYNDTGADITKIGVYGDTIIHKANHWYLNEIGDLTTQEMAEIYSQRWTSKCTPMDNYFWKATSRTVCINLATDSGLGNYTFYYSYNIEKLKLTSSDLNHILLTSSTIASIIHLHSLAKILTILNSRNITAFKNWFDGCYALEEVRISALKCNISFKDCSNISKTSAKYMIDNAIPTSAIAIILHADAYARLVDDADIIAALNTKNTALDSTGGSISLVSA